MKVSDAKRIFREYLQSYFSGADVILSRQSRTAKPSIPLVSITTGNPRRPLNPVYKMADGEVVGSYLTRLPMTIDLFTHGEPVIEDETKTIVAYENSAMDDILDLADFLGSQYTTDWCAQHDVAIVIDGDPKDLTGIVNDNNYEFRSRLQVNFYFTQYAIGYSANLDESSLLFQKPDGSGHTPEKPPATESVTGEPTEGLNPDSGNIVVPVFKPNSTGGGSSELAEQEIGYFTEVEIKEEKGNE